MFSLLIPKQADPFGGKLPKANVENIMLSSDRVHTRCQEATAFLERVLAGFSLPEPYFTQRVKQAVETLMKCLKDPSLPLNELEVKRLLVI